MLRLKLRCTVAQSHVSNMGVMNQDVYPAELIDSTVNSTYHDAPANGSRVSAGGHPLLSVATVSLGAP